MQEKLKKKQDLNNLRLKLNALEYKPKRKLRRKDWLQKKLQDWLERLKKRLRESKSKDCNKLLRRNSNG